MPHRKPGQTKPWLPKHCWPTFRWLAEYLRWVGVTQRAFQEESGIPAGTFSHARDDPDRPLPYTDQWIAAITNRTVIAYTVLKRPLPGATRGRCNNKPITRPALASWADVTAGHAIIHLCRDANMESTNAYRWRRLGYIPDTPCGRRFVAASEARRRRAVQD